MFRNRGKRLSDRAASVYVGSSIEYIDMTSDYDFSKIKDKQTLFDISARVLDGVRGVLDNVCLNAVLMYGDASTTSCMNRWDEMLG